jgi:hypothetical protein
MSIFEDSVDLGEDFIAHYGIVGMKWGVRKNNHPGASNRTNREARKDAAESARAKMFYGEGAGTRRKLIKAQIEAKSKKDPAYKAAFDHHMARQDLGRHAEKARGERRRKDTRAGVRKTGNAINRAINGPFAGSAAIALVAAGAAYARNTGMDTKAANAVKQAVSNRNLRREVQDLLRNAPNFGGRG